MSFKSMTQCVILYLLPDYLCDYFVTATTQEAVPNSTATETSLRGKTTVAVLSTKLQGYLRAVITAHQKSFFDWD